MAHAYSFQGYDAKAHARAIGVALPISTKKTTEIAAHLRGKDLEKAKRYLARVIEMKQAVEYTRFNAGGAGHKPGMSVGRYPVKTAERVLEVIEAAAANAENKGLNLKSLAIIHIAAQKGGKSWHYGRQGRRKMKRTSIEVVLAEVEQKKEKKTEKKASQTEKKQHTTAHKEHTQ